MTRHRIRIRFSKEGNLRLISHRDLVRTFERLFRRVGVPLAMSQGFHPRPKMTFPDALALGVEGRHEVTDVGLAEEVDAEQLQERMIRQAPEGLVVRGIQVLGPEDRKAKAQRVTYELPLPNSAATDDIARALDQLRQQTTFIIQRNGKQVVVDLTETLDQLILVEGRLKIDIRVCGQNQLQPRDILAYLGLQDVIREGAVLTRTQVELTK